LIKRHNHSVE